MKKGLKLLSVILTIGFLAGCGGEQADCINHIDSDHNGKCDVCEKEVSVNHIDADKNGKCDVCDAIVEHDHIDLNHDGKCDICAHEVEFNHIDADKNNKCDVCGAILEHDHVDSNHDGKCDICEYDVEVNHVDLNHDGKCDVCEHEVEVNHVDIDENLYCDVCGKDLSDIDFTKFGWDAKLARLFYVKLGIIPPYVPCISYKYEYGVDIFGDNYVNAYLFYSTEDLASAAFNQYYNTCSNADYTMTLGGLNIDAESYIDGIGYADKVLEGSKAVELTFLDSIYRFEDGSSRPALGIFATNYLYIPEDEFPREAVDNALGIFSDNIPELMADDAEFYFYFGYTENEDEEGNVYVDTKYLEIHVTSFDAFLLEEALFNSLNDYSYNDIYTTDEEGEEIHVDEYPIAYYGQEYWCYSFSFHGSFNYVVQFGVSLTSYSELYLYMVIYYDII